MDLLSDMLSLLSPSATISSGFDAGGGWAVAFGDQVGLIKCYAILKGSCWLAIEGAEVPVRLQAGEVFVLPRGVPFTLASDLSIPTKPASEHFPQARSGGKVVLGSGDDFALAGARFAVHGGPARLLLTLLPLILHFHGSTERAAMRWSLDRMMEEMREARPGALVMARDLAHMMLVQALRAYLEQSERTERGWLAALSDGKLRLAIAAIHADPARRWTLQALGEAAGMSRTVFAERFRATMGETPMRYLARWRMALACNRVERTQAPLAQIADDLGYESLSAFAVAFRRIVGVTPQNYIKVNRPGNRGNSNS